MKDTDGSSTDVISVEDNGTVTVNREAKWIQDLIKASMTNQELYPSKPIMTEGKNYASVTVTTEAGQKRASCRVTVDFKITDETTVPVSNITLNPYASSIAGENRSTYVTATTVDGGKQAVCAVNINFSTEEHTVVHVEKVQLDREELVFDIELVKEGRRSSP